MGNEPAVDRIPTTVEAVAASVACAQTLGLPGGDPEVIAEGYSTRVHLRPAPVVARVITTGRVLRGDPMPWLTREVAVAQFLAAAGAPIVPPWADPGPYLANGLEVSLWQWVHAEPGQVSQSAFGELVGELHAALSLYEKDLPPLVGPLTDIATALTVSDDAVLHRAAAELVPLALSWPRRPVHGDAHPGNVLLTAEGPRWTDFEDVCVGPVEWDFAPASVSDEAVAAYPGRIDRVRLEECRDLRRLQDLALDLADGVPDAARYDELTNALRRRL